MKKNNIIYLIEDRRYTSANCSCYNLIFKVGKHEYFSKIVDWDGPVFILRYVGIISIGNHVLSILPKYVDFLNEPEICAKHTKLLVSVFQNYSRVASEFEGVDFFADSPQEEYFSEPAVADDIIQHYCQYGLWSRQERHLTLSGSGSVNWTKTVEAIQPLITQQSVFYPQTYYNSNRTQDSHIVLLIHEWAVMYCLEKYGSILPDYEGVTHNGDPTASLDALGDSDYIEVVLEKALTESFIDSDVRILQNLMWLVRQQSNQSGEPQITFYGTGSFKYVWEAACRAAFGDMSKSPGLSKVFKAPTWINRVKKNFTNQQNKLRPDIVSFSVGESNSTLLLIDAKYYLIMFRDGTIMSNPGIEDVSKQILYQHILELDADSPLKAPVSTINTFAFPDLMGLDYDSNVMNSVWGYIDSRMPASITVPIMVLFLPPDKVFNAYLANHTIEKYPELIGELEKAKAEIPSGS